MDSNATVRLGIQDKRMLFSTLIAMVDRLLFLNKFPVDMEDFALSCEEPEVEAAWRLLVKERDSTLFPSAETVFSIRDDKFKLRLYHQEEQPRKIRTRETRIFMQHKKPLEMLADNRFLPAVTVWAQRQLRLEDQILRADKVIKALVHSCNTVGQYKRVSPDLLGFLPEKYRMALKDYTKQSPYPAITVEPEEIDTTLSTLAYAALQPPHEYGETHYINYLHWPNRRYNLDNFPRTTGFDHEKVRQHQL